MRPKIYFPIVVFNKSVFIHKSIRHEIKQYWLCLYTLLSWATRANNSFGKKERKGCKVWRTGEIKAISTTATEQDTETIRRILWRRNSVAGKRASISGSFIPFFCYSSLELLAALKTSFIKTKFHPIHLRGAASQFFMTQILFCGQKNIFRHI